MNFILLHRHPPSPRAACKSSRCIRICRERNWRFVEERRLFPTSAQDVFLPELINMVKENLFSGKKPILIFCLQVPPFPLESQDGREEDTRITPYLIGDSGKCLSERRKKRIWGKCKFWQYQIIKAD